MRVRPSGRRAASAALAAVLTTVLTLTLAPGAQAGARAEDRADTPDPAPEQCLITEYRTLHWPGAGAAPGGFLVDLTVRNRCAVPVSGWTVALTLPAGHTFSYGWAADWTASRSTVTARNLPWNGQLGPDASTAFGFVGAFSGTYQDPVNCTVNGAACDGGQAGNLPPVVTLTRPAGTTLGFLPPCPYYLTADAHDPDGEIDRVEFYLDGTLVGTATSAPYRVAISYGGLPRPIGPGPSYTIVARAYDTGDPPLSAETEPRNVTVAVGDPAPNFIVACANPWEMVAGTSDRIRFLLRADSGTRVTIEVTGDPGITVSPTTTSPTGGAFDVTVTAAPGSAGATATVTARGEGLQPASTTIRVLR